MSPEHAKMANLLKPAVKARAGRSCRLWGLVAIWLFFLAGLGGCASGSMTYFLREGADLTFIQKIAVMPFENNTKENFAAERVRNIVLTQVLVNQLFDVTETGQLEKVLEEEVGKSLSSLDEAATKRIGKRLATQAFLYGSVDEYDIERQAAYSYPKIALTLRLVDVETGLILWQGSGSLTGYSSLSRVFGAKGKDQSEVTFSLVRRLLASIK